MRKLSRKQKVVAGAVVGAVAIGGGVGIAAFISRAPLGGSVSSGQFAASWASLPAPVVSAQSSANCSVSLTSGVLTITMAEALDVASCQFTANATLAASGGRTGKIADFVVGGLPTGWTATLAPGVCGSVVDANKTEVRFTVTRSASAAAGSGGAITAAGSGLGVVPAADYVSSMCS